MENIQERKKCNRCKVNLLLKDFRLKRDGLYTKFCLHCLDGFNKRREKIKEKNKDKFQCNKCEYKCNNKSDLQKHIKQVHLKIKDFQCEQCDYNCSANSDLQRHIKQVHLKIKDHICKYEKCDMKFSTNSDLKRHMKQVHLKLKDHICEYEKCDMKFSSKSNLNHHIKRVHLKIKDFHCEECDYSCSSNGHLQTHIKTCTGKEHISSGEFQIRECLQEMNIDFQHNTSYVVKDIQLLQWDFILYKDDEVKAFIEYDGRQHFIPICFGGMSIEKAEENLRTCQKRDKIKNDFCKENNYPLLRIPYTEFGNIPQMITEFCVEHLDWGYE